MSTAQERSVIAASSIPTYQDSQRMDSKTVQIGTASDTVVIPCPISRPQRVYLRLHNTLASGGVAQTISATKTDVVFDPKVLDGNSVNTGYILNPGASTKSTFQNMTNRTLYLHMTCNVFINNYTVTPASTNQILKCKIMLGSVRVAENALTLNTGNDSTFMVTAHLVVPPTTNFYPVVYSLGTVDGTNIGTASLVLGAFEINNIVVVEM